MSTMSPRVWTGRTFLFWIMGFFAVVFAANAVFLWFAADSWSGLAAEESYRRGIDYNQVLDRATRQNALGWSTEAEFVQSDASTGTLSLVLSEASGAAIVDRDVRVQVTRPVGQGEGFSTILPMTSPGQYSARVVLSARGQWAARFEVAQPNGEPYLIETRIWLK